MPSGPRSQEPTPEKDRPALCEVDREVGTNSCRAGPCRVRANAPDAVGGIGIGGPGLGTYAGSPFGSAGGRPEPTLTIFPPGYARHCPKVLLLPMPTGTYLQNPATHKREVRFAAFSPTAIFGSA